MGSSPWLSPPSQTSPVGSAPALVTSGPPVRTPVRARLALAAILGCGGQVQEALNGSFFRV